MSIKRQTSTARVAGSTDGNLPRGISANAAIQASNSVPHDLLWDAIGKKWPGRAVREYAAGVPNRKFRIDVAFPDARLAIEMDGWQFHGKFKGDFSRDRERQNLLCLHGWRILRFTAGMVHRQMDDLLDIVELALDD